MNKLNLETLLNKGAVILDGATGSNLQIAGMPTGVCPEAWIYDHPDALLKLQKAYVDAGSMILYAPTFTANRIKLAEFSLEDRLVDINRRMVALTREAAGEGVFVAGDLTMTGQSLRPVGELFFEELVDIYKEQVAAILEEGVDLFVVETMMSLQECRAALLAVKESCDLPVMVSMTINEDGRTLFGSLPETGMVVLQAMGADAVGLNCSSGPDTMMDAVKALREVARVPILIKPNAGMPKLVDGKTVYDMTPEDFAKAMARLVEEGASIVGGCCGTTPKHIKALSGALKGKKMLASHPTKRRVVSSERKNVVLDEGRGFHIIGERINPTGKKALQAQLREGKMDMVKAFAREQEASGAEILDVNMGTNGINELEMMKTAIEELTYTVDLPLCIDTSYINVMEAALRIYPGRALINSISAESNKYKELLRLAKKYGAMFILLPLSEAGLPRTIEEKHNHIDTVLSEAKKIGLGEDDVVVDLLVSTIGADADAAKKCLMTASYCSDELGLATVCGLSNISFGLPQRSFVNTAFFVLALSKGLTMAIANPSQELLMYMAYATDMLLNKAQATDRFLDAMPTDHLVLCREDDTEALDKDREKKIEKKDEDRKEEALHPLTKCVLRGETTQIIEEVQKALDEGNTPSVIINDYLIAGINLVGRYYEEKRFFLPQLIAGANAMKEAMDFLEPLLASDKEDEKDVIVFATVEGDIHDIGKNLVVLMLKNYGYRVMDLGKDVPAKEIVECAKKEGARIIGLSALMTTTMMRMKEVVELKNNHYPSAKVVIGGACITESFAKEIGADGYSEDAADCVRLVRGLLEDA